MRKSIRAKTPSLRSREASQQPPYRRRGAAKQAKNHTEIDSDMDASEPDSDDEIRVNQQ